MSVSPKFFTKTPKKNISPIKNTIDKNEEFSRQVTALISIELSRIDEEDIKNGINSLFVSQTEEQSIFIKGLLDKINNVKINIINKVKDFIIQNSNISNFNLDKNDSNDNSIINELKNLQKNMKIKLKQLNDCLSLSLNNSINQLSNYITLDKKDKALDKINKFDKIINDLSTIVKGIENLNNKTIENILGKNSNNIKKNNNNNQLRNYSRSPIKFNTATENQLKLKKTSSFIRYNNHSKNISPLNSRNFYNDNFNNKTVNNISNIMTDSSLNRSNNSSFNLDNNTNYKKKIREKIFEIENLKSQLLKEKENKNTLLNELTKLKFNKKLSTTKINNIDYDSINSKISKLTEMVINFSYSMNNLRDSIYKKSISNLESKSFFTKLKNKLVSLVNETENLNKNLLILGANIKENLEKENEENKKKETIEITKPTNLNNSLAKSEKNTNNIYNNITLNNNSNYDIEKIIAENKNLKAQIASQILLRSPKSNNEKDKSNENEIISLKNQIKKLQIELNEKNKEIDIINDNKINEYFNNLKEDYQKNIKNIQNTYEQIIKEKENENNILNENNNEYEKEVYELRANLLKISNEYRTKHILIETKINNLENEKKNLEIQIENLNNENEDKDNKKENINSNNINNDFNEEIISLKQKNENLEIIVENLNKQIEEKNNHINIITKNHQEDLNELNASIMVLKTKIAQLQEENESLSYSQREILEKLKN